LAMMNRPTGDLNFFASPSIRARCQRRRKAGQRHGCSGSRCARATTAYSIPGRLSQRHRDDSQPASLSLFSGCCSTQPRSLHADPRLHDPRRAPRQPPRFNKERAASAAAGTQQPLQRYDILPAPLCPLRPTPTTPRHPTVEHHCTRGTLCAASVPAAKHVGTRRPVQF